MEISKEIKCVIWDLDNTLWDGILLESGEVKLKPGIREILATLDSRGILHSIASKNSYEDAMAKLKEFGLDEYFLYPEINWNAKSVSIENIRRNLNLAADTFLFIDDQPFERDEVKAAHSGVECIDAAEYLNLLNRSRLNPAFITEDSGRRRKMYQTDIYRRQMEDSFTGTPEEFLASLDMCFTISRATEEDLKRAEELTVRTHQLNTTGITYDYDELFALCHSTQHLFLVAELTDKYGSYGKIGIAVVEISAEYWHLKLLLMSCRVLSRGVGSVMLSHIMQEAGKNTGKLLADFRKTERNRMMFVTYKFANFKTVSEAEDGYILFENDLSQITPFPPYLRIQIK